MERLRVPRPTRVFLRGCSRLLVAPKPPLPPLPLAPPPPPPPPPQKQQQRQLLRLRWLKTVLTTIMICGGGDDDDGGGYRYRRGRGGLQFSRVAGTIITTSSAAAEGEE